MGLRIADQIMFQNIKYQLANDNESVKKTLCSNESVNKYLFKAETDVNSRLDKVIRYLKMRSELKLAKKEVEHKNCPEAITHIEAAISLQGGEKIEKVIFENFKGNDSRMAFSSARPFDQKKSIEKGLDYLDNHPTNQVFKSLSALELPNEQLESWQKKYIALCAYNDPVCPDPFNQSNPKQVEEISKRWLEVFNEAPTLEVKKQIATDLLFPKSSYFCPVAYIIVAANLDALEAIIPHLPESDDWSLSRHSDYKTLLDVLITGLKKMSTLNGDPVQCAEILLEKCPSSDSFNPIKSINGVINNLETRLKSLQDRGLNSATYFDRKGEWNESIEDYEKIICQAKEIKGLLSSESEPELEEEKDSVTLRGVISYPKRVYLTKKQDEKVPQ
jgi:hypothetical protein